MASIINLDPSHIYKRWAEFFGGGRGSSYKKHGVQLNNYTARILLLHAFFVI
jgi:hypothetical protein